MERICDDSADRGFLGIGKSKVEYWPALSTPETRNCFDLYNIAQVPNCSFSG